jgi:predicted nucleotidyltransferase
MTTASGKKASGIYREEEVSLRIPLLARNLSILPEVVAVYLFGSFARGNPRRGSDVDIAVFTKELSSPRRRSRSRDEYAAAASKALGTDRVDVVVLNQAPVVLRHEVFRDGKLLFVRDRSGLSRFRVRSSREYLDTIPLRRTFEKAYFRKIREKGFERKAPDR